MKKNVFDIKEICTVPPPHGGCTVYVDRLIKELTKDGYKVGGYYDAQCDNKAIVNSEMFDEWKWMETSKFPFKIWKYLREARPYKVIHSHFSLEGMLYLWTIKTFLNKKIVVTVHNSMNSNYYRTTNPINRLFLHKMLKSTDVTWITVSEQGKKQLESFPIKPVTPIHIIPAYIPISGAYTPLGQEMQQYIDGHDQIISFYGHSFMVNEGVDIYGFEAALRMFSSIIKRTDHKVGLVMCLAETRDKEKISALHSLAKQLGVDNKIFWQIGAINNIRSLWHQTNIYIRPTSTDGDSVAVREVLDEGVVVVASDVCIRPEGVVTYNHSDLNDFIEKVTNNLSKEKSDPCPNYAIYDLMKSVYDTILK